MNMNVDNKTLFKAVWIDRLDEFRKSFGLS